MTLRPAAICRTKTMSCSMTTMLCFPGEAEQEFAGLVRFLVGHAGGGFIDEQELRVLREEHADFEPLLLAVRERAGFPIALGRRG